MTDATLTKAQTRRLAIMAQDGMARALRPIHTPLDGDDPGWTATVDGRAASVQRANLVVRALRGANMDVEAGAESGQHPACYVHQQDWGVPVRLARRLRPVCLGTWVQVKALWRRRRETRR